MGKLEILNTCFLILLFVLSILAFFNEGKIYPVIIYFFLIIFLFYLNRNKNKKLFNKIFIWYPVFYLSVVFESFFMIIPYINVKNYDRYFNNLDYKLLGFYPTVICDKINFPFLTDFLYLIYALYFFYPFIYFIPLSKTGNRVFIRKSVFIIFICLYLCYTGYFILPAKGPRFFPELVHQKDLNGILISNPIKNIINFFEPNKNDIFPSAHAAIALVFSYLVFKYLKNYFVFFLFTCIGIYFSTIYLRYHYFVDLLAGLIIAIIAIIIGEKSYGKY